jgi:hypothetical protein
LGLSAVLEEQDGTKSYWALAHPPGGKPDFHHPDCFVRGCLASRMTLFGIDRLLADPSCAPLEGKRVALLAHPASVTRGPDPQPRRARRAPA